MARKRKKSSSKDSAEGCAGCLIIMLIIGVIGMILEFIIEHIKPIMIIVAVIALIAIAIPLIKKLRENAEIKAAQEAEEKERREREAYDAYFRAQDYSDAKFRLNEANAIIRKLFEEQDVGKREKIIAFFDKYLPLMTEMLEARKHGDAGIGDAIEKFTETVKAFSKELYEVEDVVDINSTMIENLSISDGLYDPYKETFAVNAETVSEEPVEVASDAHDENISDDAEPKEVEHPAADEKADEVKEEPEEEMIVLEEYE